MQLLRFDFDVISGPTPVRRPSQALPLSRQVPAKQTPMPAQPADRAGSSQSAESDT